ncbi:OsmC family protein [Aliifodinibius salicampi]|uniref:OsmC family protein n=1 Tax=Fodinibius salicampi TaxID=1920655 RepID=A0ABT3PTX6_9BACT|nr:OsmC family protein [Fodinibius salicampi]MCW9711303.1 OsmC family protein [Fodinibius salicampi]
MADPKTIKKAYERNRRAVELRPQKGKSTAVTKVRLFDGTTCEVQHKHWTFKVDIGISEGGNDAGPGPGIMERGALGSCLAIAYSQHAAIMGVPVDKIEVDIESDFDARGMLAIDDRPPGFEELRYKVYIESTASEEEVQKVIDKADRHSPVLDDFKRAIPVKREVTIKTINEERS